MPEIDGSKPASCMVNIDFLRDLDVFNEWMNDNDYRVGDHDEVLEVLNDEQLQQGHLLVLFKSTAAVSFCLECTNTFSCLRLNSLMHDDDFRRGYHTRPEDYGGRECAAAPARSS